MKHLSATPLIVALSLLGTGCLEKKEEPILKKPMQEARVAEEMKSIPVINGKSPWGIREFVKSVNGSNGDYLGFHGDDLVFNNGKTVSKIGYDMRWLESLPNQAHPEVHLFRAADCWECEASLDLLMVFVPSLKIEKVTFPGAIKGFDSENGGSPFDQARTSVRVGHCGPYLAIGKYESHDKKSAPWKTGGTWGLQKNSNGQVSLVQDPRGRKEILTLFAAPSPECREVPGVDREPIP